MQTAPQNPEPQAPPAGPVATSSTPPPTQPGLVRKRLPVFLLVTILLALPLALWWLNHARIDRIEREFAYRIQEGDSQSKESRIIARQARDQVAALQTRIGVLEARLAESQGQQLALEQLYQELSRGRDEWALAEVEQVLAVAAQQLQLAGNVQAAVIALQNVDSRLARSDKPQFIPLRRAIERDLERLKALPGVDLAGNALRLDSLVSMVDSLPLLSDEKPAPRPRLDARPVVQTSTVKNGQASLAERIRDGLRHGLAEFWQEMQQLIRVRQVSQPDALLLAPSQSYFVRENLKLRLLNARLALLARQESIYRSDLLTAQELLQNYFDVNSRQTVAALALLKQIQASNTVVELPTLAESLTAVRNFNVPRHR